MSFNIVAIIPARGESKSIPRKNICSFAGKPLIAYPIELAKSIKRINRVIVSSEDSEIIEIAKKYGAEVPFVRPKELAEDKTATKPVLQHCVKYLEKNENYKIDIIVLLVPTCPLLTADRVNEALDLLESGKYGTVISVEKDLGRYWKQNIDGKYKMFYPKVRVNRQYYKPLYKENGAIYFCTYETLMGKDKIIDTENLGFLIMKPGEVIDIDFPNDWKKAEKKSKLGGYK